MRVELEAELTRLVIGLGFDLVSVEWGGSHRRPLLRLRVDHPDAPPGRSSVTADECAAISRAVGEYLEESADLDGAFILEVSSPGVERPLVRPDDFDRFAGERVVIRGYGRLPGGERQVEGTLLGVRGAGQARRVALEVEGRQLELPLASIAKATLAYCWEDDLRAKS